MKREEIIELVNKINNNPKRLKRGLYPLEYTDDGFRIVFSVYLEQFTFLPEGKALWKEAIIDQDFKGCTTGSLTVKFQKDSPHQQSNCPHYTIKIRRSSFFGVRV